MVYKFIIIGPLHQTEIYQNLPKFTSFVTDANVLIVSMSLRKQQTLRAFPIIPNRVCRVSMFTTTSLSNFHSSI